MTSPGWYPDPADASLLRYFDGEEWGDDTRAADGATAPRNAGQWGGSSRFWGVAGVLAALLLPALTFFLVPHPRPDIEAGEPTAVATVAAPDGSDLPLATRCVVGTRLPDSPKPAGDAKHRYGGGLVVGAPAGWKLTDATTFVTITDQQGAWRSVGSGKNERSHDVAVGGVSRHDPWTATLRGTARHLTDCVVLNGRNKIRHTVREDRAVTVDGHQAWRRRVELEMRPWRGSHRVTVEVVVVDVGSSEHYGVLGWRTFDGDPTADRDVAALLPTLRVR